MKNSASSLTPSLFDRSSGKFHPVTGSMKSAEPLTIDVVCPIAGDRVISDERVKTLTISLLLTCSFESRVVVQRLFSLLVPVLSPVLRRHILPPFLCLVSFNCAGPMHANTNRNIDLSNGKY